MAVYVIREVTKIDIYSSPPINVSFMDFNSINFMPSYAVDFVEKVLSDTNKGLLDFLRSLSLIQYWLELRKMRSKSGKKKMINKNKFKSIIKIASRSIKKIQESRKEENR